MLRNHFAVSSNDHFIPVQRINLMIFFLQSDEELFRLKTTSSCVHSSWPG